MEYSTHIVCTLLPLLMDKSAVDKILGEPSGPSLEQKMNEIVETLAEAASRNPSTSLSIAPYPVEACPADLVAAQPPSETYS